MKMHYRLGNLGLAGFPALAAAALVAAILLLRGAAAQELTTLYSFIGSDGAYPDAGLIADPAGNLYGTTQVGGANPSCNQAPGCGTVFQLMPSGTLTVLHSFAGSDGEQPFAGLIADAAGNLYGTTWGGGASGRGTIFQLDPSGTLTVLHSFTGGSDGQRPVTGLLADAAGNLYGTTGGGGDGGYGTVFQLDSSGTLTVLYSFTGGTDGRNPDSGLIADAAGNLYGTINQGGDLASCNSPNTHGCGTVFQLTPPGSLTVLHRFAGSDGSRPVDWAGLLADAAGNLYGTTSAGGDCTSCAVQFIEGCGTVFQLTPSGALTVLYSFTGGSDGGDPTAALIADTAGNLYGTTLEGGATGSCNRPYGCGTVFQLTPSGTLNAPHLHRQRRVTSRGLGRPPRRRGGQSLWHDPFRRRRYELHSGLRHGVPADAAGESHRGAGQAKYEREKARSRRASEGPPVTIYGSSNKRLSSTIRIRRQSAACSRGTSS
jgi:uncharacterized repeat protein (TIGR03803 family)